MVVFPFPFFFGDAKFKFFSYKNLTNFDIRFYFAIFTLWEEQSGRAMVV